MTRKKPWNRVNLPVYSISSGNEEQNNMNIITYVTAISMQPKRFICGIYHGTKTLENVESSGSFVLQLLSDQQVNLVNLLGKQTGRTVPKIQRLQKRKELMMWNEFPVLKNALALMKMKVVESMEGGDHKVFLCDVVDYINLNEGEVLTLDHLREKKLIRI